MKCIQYVVPSGFVQHALCQKTVLRRFGTETDFSTCLEKDHSNAVWEKVWDLYERRLRVAGSDPQDEMNDILSVNTE